MAKGALPPGTSRTAARGCAVTPGNPAGAKKCDRAGGILGEGERCLIKDDMSRDDDPVGGPIKAGVAFVVRRITEEDTHGGARSEFVGSSGGEVGVAPTSEDTEMVI